MRVACYIVWAIWAVVFVLDLITNKNVSMAAVNMVAWFALARTFEVRSK
jgi:hypothetical protein